MIELNNSLMNHFYLFLTAALLGAVGGIAFELLQTRGRVTGALERPRWKAYNGRYIDLGWISSVIVGAVAALVVLYLFPPEVTQTVENGVTVEARSYEIVKLVALSLIAGSAGRAILTAAQTRVQATLTEQRVSETEAVAKAELHRLAVDAEREVDLAIREATRQVLGMTRTQVVPPDGGGTTITPPEIDAEMTRIAGQARSHLQSMVASAEQAVSQVARPTTDDPVM